MMQYKIGKSPKILVCRQAFRMTYGIKRDRLRVLAKDFFEGRKGEPQRQVSTSAPYDLTESDKQTYHAAMSQVFDLKLSNEQEAAMMIPNSHVAFACWAWMDRYFNIVGDFEPNTKGEIHLEPTLIKDIWKTYQSEISSDGKTTILNVYQFGQLWNSCFSYTF